MHALLILSNDNMHATFNTCKCARSLHFNSIGDACIVAMKNQFRDKGALSRIKAGYSAAILMHCPYQSYAVNAVINECITPPTRAQSVHGTMHKHLD
jgi:hypothetical protein